MLKTFVVNTGLRSGGKTINGKEFTVIKANEHGIIFPANKEEEQHILHSEDFKNNQVAEISLATIGRTAEEKFNDSLLQQLHGALTTEQIEQIQALPEVAKKAISENIDSILGSYKTAENTDKPTGDVKIEPVGSGEKKVDENTKKEFALYDDITVEKLKEYLDNAEVPHDPKMLKPELYKLAKGHFDSK